MPAKTPDGVMDNPKRFLWAPALIVAITILLLLAGHLGLRKASARATSTGDATTTQTATTRVNVSQEDRLQFTLEVPAVHLGADGQVSVPGLRQVRTVPGAPALPAFSTYIALPPGAVASVAVNAGNVESQIVEDVQPWAQETGVLAGEDFERLSTSLVAPSYEASAEIYGRDERYPGRFYALSEPMYFRDLRLVRLDLFPIQYNPVQHVLEQATSMDITVEFTGAEWENRQPVADDGSYLETIAPLVINFDRAQEWRSLPVTSSGPGTKLPANQDTFKIAVDKDGIYEITYDDLQAAGMDVQDVDPNTFEMMYRGEPVAYEFVGDQDEAFEVGERIRFYGWAFNGSRLERQFLTENVFWLWANGNATRIETVGSVDGNLVAADFRESITREPELNFTHVWTDNWEDAPNEPDAWIWERVEKVVDDGPTLERVHEITLPVPAASGTTALVTVEILSRHSRPDHDVSIYLNGNSAINGSLQWSGPRSVNVTMSVPAAQLLEGVNHVHVVYATPVTSQDSAPAIYYMNRITVEYDRRFVTTEDQLIFVDDDGNSTYQVGGFSNGDLEDATIWEISNPRTPVSTAIEADGIQGSGPFTYTFGTSSGSSAYVVTHSDNLRQPRSIVKYVGPDLDPLEGAGWLAISHADFIAQAQQLATHRARSAHGGFDTHVVDVQDVINQYGYGLPLPGAIRHFLQHAIANWPVAPRHLLLVGDGHINPRQIPCPPENTQCNHWATTPETNYVLTDIVFTDQFVGINASDYSYSLLSGDDLLPDLTVGRLAVQSAAEAQVIVNKIIHYETSRFTPAAWQRNVLFVADNTDGAGNFCVANETVANRLPAPYDSQLVCLASNTTDDIAEAQTQIFDAVNNPPESGATFMNYRGHGAVRGWAGQLINLDAADPWMPWFNNEPLIILSMDCLDGYFAQPGYEALSEEFLAIPYYGSVAHWSSTGFGYDFQHGPLHESFYEGLFEHDLTKIGDAINFAKLSYTMQSHHPSQLYSFTLQGDPAMEMVRFSTYLPALQK